MKKTPASTVAKHVFGELALKDILPMIADCDAITVEEVDGDLDGEELIRVPFKVSKHGINVFQSREALEEDEGFVLLFPKEKVVVKSDQVEYLGRMLNLRLTFFRGGEPFVFNILEPCARLVSDEAKG